MTVHIGELTTEVAVEPGRSSRGSSSPPARQPGWMDRDRLRAMRERLARDEARTAAEGFDGDA